MATENEQVGTIIIVPTVGKEQLYKDKGFSTAIAECGNKKALDTLIDESRKVRAARETEIQDRYEVRISWLTSKVRDAETALREARSNNTAIARLDKVRSEIVTLYTDFGREKRTFIEKRLDDFTAEIRKLFESENLIYDRWRQLNEKAYKDNKARLDVTRSRIETLRSEYVERNDIVHEQLKKMDKGGVDTAAFQYLLSTGMALIAGWFFSVFLVTLNAASSGTPTTFGQQDVWFFLLKSILQALSPSLLIAIGQVALMLLIIGAGAYLAQLLLSKLNPETNRQDFTVNYNSNRESGNNEELINQLERRFQFNFSSDSLYALFLQAMPVMLSLGVIFAILRQSIDPSVGFREIEKLDASIAGQAAGTAIAFAIGSMILLFYSKIEDISKITTFNRAMLATTVLFPLILVLPMPHEYKAILGFVFATAISGTAMAFGIRYRGLRKMSDELNEAIGLCTRVIAHYSSPIPVNMHSNDFRSKIRDIWHSHLDFVGGRTKSVEDMQKTQDVEVVKEKKGKLIERIKNGLINWAKGLIGKNKPVEEATIIDDRNIDNEAINEPDSSPTYNLSYALEPSESRNFPDYQMRFLAMQQEYHDAKKTDYEATKLVRELEAKIDELVKEIVTTKEALFQSKRSLYESHDFQENCIREGFELGIWHLKNDLLPNRDCPPLYIDLPIPLMAPQDTPEDVRDDEGEDGQKPESDNNVKPT